MKTVARQMRNKKGKYYKSWKLGLLNAMKRQPMWKNMTFKETDMLNAWLWEKHRTDTQWRRIRLGVLPTKELARAYMTILRWADAIYLKDGVVHIVEAKLRADPGALG